MDQTPVVILFRWLHILPAALAVGGVFFLRIILPAATESLEPGVRQEVMLRCRRLFKFTIHTCILLLIISGTVNTLRLWHGYNLRPGVLHGVFGIHLALALAIFAISLRLLGGAQPPQSHRTWAMVNLVLLLLAVLAAGTLKTLREGAATTASASGR